MKIDNEINLIKWDNRISDDGVTNVGYDDDVRSMNIMFAMMEMY